MCGYFVSSLECFKKIQNTEMQDLLSEVKKAEIEESLGGLGRKWRQKSKMLSVSEQDKVGQRKKCYCSLGCEELKRLISGVFKYLVFLLRETTYREYKTVSKKRRLEEVFRFHLV